ncbi:hypothetical protein PS2_036040 [Malus domestica]
MHKRRHLFLNQHCASMAAMRPLRLMRVTRQRASVSSSAGKREGGVSMLKELALNLSNSCWRRRKVMLLLLAGILTSQHACIV